MAAAQFQHNQLQMQHLQDKNKAQATPQYIQYSSNGGQIVSNIGHQKQGSTSQSGSRPRPRSSAPAASLKKRINNSGAMDHHYHQAQVDSQTRQP